MKIKFIVTTTFALLAANSSAGGFGFVPPTYTPGTTQTRTATSNSAYAGLVWTLKEKHSLIPDLTVGVRSLRTDSNDRATGADLGVRIELSRRPSVDSVRLSYVGGSRDTLWNAGVGYSLASASIISTFGVQAQNLRFGADYAFGPAKLTPYVELNTLRQPEKVYGKETPGSYSCPQGTTLIGGLCYSPFLIP